MTNKNYWVHESSYVDEGAKIGKGTKIWFFSHICSNTVIGENCVIGQNVFVENDTIIGNNVHLHNNVSVYARVILEDDVFCGPSMVFTNDINPRAGYHKISTDDYLPTLVKRGASIGANSTIICGNTLGYYCFVGAGSVVTRDIPDYAVVYGVPAIIRGWMCKCGEMLKFTIRDSIEYSECVKCAQKYTKEDELVKLI